MCDLCGSDGYVMVPEYDSDRDVPVKCSKCGGKSKTKKSRTSTRKVCGYCDGTGELTIKASDGTPRYAKCACP